MCHDAKVVSWLLKEMTTASSELEVVEVTVKTGFRTKSHLQTLCKEESNQHWAGRCKTWSGTTSSKNGFSLQLKTSSSWYWDKRCGQGAWTWSRTSIPQKCPSSRRWCQHFWALSIGHAGRPTWAAVCSQWVHSCWQHLHRGTWCALKFTISSASLNDNVWKLAGICKLPP